MQEASAVYGRQVCPASDGGHQNPLQVTFFPAGFFHEDFNAIPFINADGYHSKTIAYSLWHIFRIEDIVAHTLIKGDEQVFFREGYQKRINSPVITTGNELVKQEIADFSEQLDLDELYSYLSDVKRSTESILRDLSYDDLRRVRYGL